MSNVSGRLGRTLSGIAATAAVAATLLLVPTSATAVEGDGPHYQEPVVGECRNYTVTAAVKASNSTPVTACSSTHTAKVFAVGQLPASLTWNASMDQLSKAVGKTCDSAFDAAVGGTAKVRKMAAYTYWWFMPTQAQRDHGARWFRCDVSLYGRSLPPMPSNSNPLLRNGSLTYAVTRCRYGTNHYATACSGAHDYRATGAFTMSGASYPGDRAVEAATQRRCPGLTNTRMWLGYHPTREWWRYGDRVTVCYSKTAH